MKSKVNDKTCLSAYFLWYGIVSIVLVIMGMIFSIFGFTIFPESILSRNILLSWESAIYGSVLAGLGTMLFLLGRHAFHKKDPELMRIMLIGIAVWLFVEALFSAYLGVFFNVGVDIAVFILFSFPTIKMIHYMKQK